ncbi:hypothetical protein QJS10_CPA06g01296 [Acorus calamus]|uniref:RNase H type-1 domain-containing protein n=1 Tax=Acorus calamus TaxID=4465 RepID=A0AAV9EML3_ACOCL|nr:hypothetical protein QJS10_CPA06g01296 [Acorus calamus]
MNSQVWSRHDRILVFIDGSTDMHTHEAGISFVLVHEESIQVLGAGYRLWPWASPTRAKVEAIKEALVFARRCNLHTLCVCSDSSFVIILLQGRMNGSTHIRDCVEDIRRLHNQNDLGLLHQKKMNMLSEISTSRFEALEIELGISPGSQVEEISTKETPEPGRPSRAPPRSVFPA